MADTEKRLKALKEDDGISSREWGTFLENLGNRSALGHLPQLQALAEPSMTEALDSINGTHVADDLPKYVDRRDENIARLKALSDESPLAAGLGGVAGAAPLTVGATSGVLRPAMEMGLKGLGIAAGLGAGAGAAYNPGDEKGVVSPLQIEERAKNAAKGVPIGVLDVLALKTWKKAQPKR